MKNKGKRKMSKVIGKAYKDRDTEEIFILENIQEKNEQYCFDVLVITSNKKLAVGYYDHNEQKIKKYYNNWLNYLEGITDEKPFGSTNLFEHLDSHDYENNYNPKEKTL